MANLNSEQINTNIKVSVIIPTYNRERFIKDAIESVLNQTFKDFEIIVVDDGSTDNTREILKQYGNKIKVLLQDHKGCCAARNTGIRAAKGKYIALLDSDDIWYPVKLERQIKVIEETKAGLVHTARYQVDISNKKPRFLLPLLPAKSSLDFLSGKTHISVTVLVAKETLTAAGLFDENLPTTEDTDLWLRIAKISDIVYIDEPLMDCRMHGDNMQGKLDLKYRDRIVVYRKVLSDPDKRIPRSIWKRKLAVNYYLFAKLRYGKQDFKKSLNYVSTALTLDPFVGAQNMNAAIGWIAIDSPHGIGTRIKMFLYPYILLAKDLIKIIFSFTKN